mmetsp:Transcript_18074/g.54485  ORF Transcript_18074/g.54485 Transcript_18074/m.54485 type:complete len:210 (+) Transcript_18074:1899-2528(+)
MKGCWIAWQGLQRVDGSNWSRPKRKDSMAQRRSDSASASCTVAWGLRGGWRVIRSGSNLYRKYCLLRQSGTPISRAYSSSGFSLHAEGGGCRTELAEAAFPSRVRFAEVPSAPSEIAQLVTAVGAPLLTSSRKVLAARIGSKNFLASEHRERKESEGTPSISTTRRSWLYSDSPGNSGRPRKNSPTIQPRDQVSTSTPYGWPKSTSGER